MGSANSQNIVIQDLKSEAACEELGFSMTNNGYIKKWAIKPIVECYPVTK